MRKFFSRYEGATVLLSAIFVTVFLFRGYFFEHKTLFPSNLLVSTYSPWKYEPPPEYPNGPPNRPIGFDNIRESYPDRELLRSALMKGTLPLWNPYIYSGAPFMAAGTTSVWYPLSWIEALLPAGEGWNFLVIVQPIASIVFMYLFLKSVTFPVRIALFGAFAYALSGWMVVYWQEFLVLGHSFLWLPLALYASNRLWERKNDVVGYFLLIFALVFSVFAGFLQMTIYVYTTVILWNIYKSYVHRRLNMHIGMAITFSIFIASIQIIPSVEAFLLSPRGTIDGSFVFRDDLLSWQHIVTLLAPDYWGSPATYNYFGGPGFYFEKMIFIGIIPFLFAVYGMINAKQKAVTFWTVMGLVSFSMGFALPTSWLPYFLHIPILSTSYPTRIFAVSAFAFILLSSYGLEAFLKDSDRKKMTYILTGLSAVLAVGWAVVINAVCIVNNGLLCFRLTSVKDTGLYATVTLRNLIVPTAFLLSGWVFVSVRRFSKKLVFILVCVLTMASCLYFAQKYVYYGEERFMYPNVPVITKLSQLAGYDRVWGYGNAFIEKNFSEYFQWFSTDGYSNLSPRRYAELVSTITSGGKLGGSIRRSDTDLYAMSERDTMDANPYRLRMMSLLGVKYVVESKVGDLKDTVAAGDRFPASLFSLVWQDKTWRIWQYSRALPRVMFPTTAIVERDGQKIVDTLYDTSFDLTRTVILESEPKDGTGLPDAIAGQATITSHSLNTVSVQARSPSGGFVVLTDNYYPGWTVTVDGKTAPVLRADYSFRAVAVPKGTHTIVFAYKPFSVIIGVVIAVVGVLLGVAFIVYDKVRRKK